MFYPALLYGFARTYGTNYIDKYSIKEYAARTIRNATQQQPRTKVHKWNHEHVHTLRPHVKYILPPYPATPNLMSVWLLGRCSRQLQECADAVMVHSWSHPALILEHYFASKPFAAGQERQCWTHTCQHNTGTLCKATRNTIKKSAGLSSRRWWTFPASVV
jgi:hypothetical protein